MSAINTKLAELAVTLTSYQAGLTTKINNKLSSSEVGTSVARLVDGVVPSGELPSYVDNMDEFANVAAFPAVGVAERIYLDLSAVGVAGAVTQYRWSGSSYQGIVSSPGSTDSITEGPTNKYFTAARASAAAPVQSVAGLTGVIAVAGLKAALGISIADVANLATSLAGKAPLTGAGTSGTWGISITGNAATATTANSATNATHATSADQATTAVNAGTAVSANSLNANNDYQIASLGVGTAAPGSNGIRAVGDITGFYSDERLKTRISGIENATAGLMSLTPFIYKANEKAISFGFAADVEYVGLSAGEVNRVFRHAVRPAPFDIQMNEDGTESSKSGENYLTIQYERMVAYLIKGFQEQQTELASLKNELEQLRASVGR